MRINQNIGAMNAHYNMFRVDTNLGSSLEKLSSGLRINRASDDAGGLAISEGMRGQVRGIQMAIKNAQDGIALINTAESVLDTVHAMLQRGRELAVQASNPLVINQRDAIAAEITQIQDEIDRLGTATEFNGTRVFTAGGTITLQIGADNQADHTLAIDTGTLAAATIGATGNIDSPPVDFSTHATSRLAIRQFNDAIDSLSLHRSRLGAQSNRLEYTVDSLQVARENIASAESRIRDVDMASEMTNLTRNQILLQSSTAMLAQANARPQAVLSLLR